MSFTALRRRCQENMYELVKAEQAMGLIRSSLFPPCRAPRGRTIPNCEGCPCGFIPRYRRGNGGRRFPASCTRNTRRRRQAPDQRAPFGRLAAWRSHPFRGRLPGAARRQAAAHRCLGGVGSLAVPVDGALSDDIARFKAEVERAHAFVREHGVLLAGGWGVGADMANWLCGFENLMLLEHDQPAFVDGLLEMIHVWNRQRMAVVLSGKVDLFIYRAWYEGCDFVSPKFFREAILPRLKSDVALAHEHGALFGYICSSGLVPLLDDYQEAGIDVLIGIDPVQGTHTDLAAVKKKAAGRICLWGGVSGAITVEMGAEEEIRAAVRQAIATLGPEGFVLSPVDNITVDAPQTWQNLEVFIDEWKRRRNVRRPASDAA